MEYRIHVADHCHTDDNQDKREYFFRQQDVKKALSLTCCKVRDGIGCLREQIIGYIFLVLLEHLIYKNTRLTSACLPVGMLGLKRQYI
jgi:hypothetical protein